MTTQKQSLEGHPVAHFVARPEFHVRTDFEGHPCAVVPCEWMWDLVEYLSYHRLNLSYHFDNMHFRIVFLCQTASAAQRLLDDWSHATVDEPAHLEHDDVR